jgi:intracellular septation protein A
LSRSAKALHRPYSVKFLFDFFPVILFFVAYKFADIFVATGAAIVATKMSANL